MRLTTTQKGFSRPPPGDVSRGEGQGNLRRILRGPQQWRLYKTSAYRRTEAGSGALEAKGPDSFSTRGHGT
eukprot:8656643-Pyramimonas_sp.AAC.1